MLLSYDSRSSVNVSVMSVPDAGRPLNFGGWGMRHRRLVGRCVRACLLPVCFNPATGTGSRGTIGQPLSLDGDSAQRELDIIPKQLIVRYSKFNVRRWAWLLPLTFVGCVAFADDFSERDAAQASAKDIPEVVVVGVSPVQGAGVPLDEAPSNVQTLTARQIEKDHAQTLTDVLDREFSSLALSDTEGSPFQKDFSFRGFTASPVLGTPAGIAIYQNGIRVNEPFGDTVLWDFIPVFALEKLQLIPGSNPVFGLNALGGAVTFQMKDGFYDSGTSVDLSGGSFGREKGVLECGVRWGDFAFYTGALVSHETDWRQYSPSTLVQSFSDLALKERTYSLGLSLTLAGSSLNGNGASPANELAISRSAIFAIPDTEHNRLVFLQGRGQAAISDTVSLQGVTYYRHSRQTTYNGQYSGFEACEDNGAILCNDDGARRNRPAPASDSGIPSPVKLRHSWCRHGGVRKGRCVVCRSPKSRPLPQPQSDGRIAAGSRGPATDRPRR